MTLRTSAIQSIETVVAGYVDGMTRADASVLRRVFHPKAHCIGHYQGGLEWDTLDGFIAACAEAASDEVSSVYWRTQSVSITGDTAVVRVENDFAGSRFDDTLTLLEHEGRWQIVSKLFHHRPGQS
jgi:hypothetical protein